MSEIENIDYMSERVLLRIARWIPDIPQMLRFCKLLCKVVGAMMSNNKHSPVVGKLTLS